MSRLVVLGICVGVFAILNGGYLLGWWVLVGRRQRQHAREHEAMRQRMAARRIGRTE
jgi:hypothetical protein